MATISAKDVMELRKQTDCGMMECKKALTDAEGDFAKAVELLREKGLATASKKAGRVAAEGMVYATACSECKVGVALEVNAETDFVAKNDKFVDFVKKVADVIIKENPADVEALMACKMGEGTVDDALKNLILVIKENIKVRRFTRYEGVCAAYIHAGGTHAVLVNFDTTDEVAAKPEFAVYGKDIAMQIAAANPTYVCREEVPADVLDKEKEILLAQALEENKTAAKPKPEQIIHKMVDGRIGKYYEENCLLQQAFVKENKVSVEAHIKAVAKELGGEIKLVKCVRFEKGEGIEKKVDDFAAEVAAMAK